jgi:hypothetical protein
MTRKLWECALSRLLAGQLIDLYVGNLREGTSDVLLEDGDHRGKRPGGVGKSHPSWYEVAWQGMIQLARDLQ